MKSPLNDITFPLLNKRRNDLIQDLHKMFVVIARTYNKKKDALLSKHFVIIGANYLIQRLDLLAMDCVKRINFGYIKNQ